MANLNGKCGAASVSLLQTSFNVAYSSGMGSDPYEVFLQPSLGVAITGAISKSSDGFSVPIVVSVAGTISWQAVYRAD